MPETKNEPYLGLRGSKPNSEGSWSTRNPPLFVLSKPQIRPTRRLSPLTSGHLVEPEGGLARARLGANGGSTTVPRAKKIMSSKVVSRPLGMLKQVYIARFEPVVTHFGPCKMPKCLANGPFSDLKRVNNGSKTRCSKSDPGPFGMLKKRCSLHFEPVMTRFGAWNIPKCLEMTNNGGGGSVKYVFLQN